MSEFISTLEMVEQSSYDEKRRLMDEIAELDFDLRRTMDKGLSVDDMKKASAARHAVQSAQIILEKLFS